MKKVLVTGAGGFIGSTLVETLVTYGYDVKAFCHYNSRGSLGWLNCSPKELLDSVEVVSGDIRDLSCVEKAVTGCDTVMHVAS